MSEVKRISKMIGAFCIFFLTNNEGYVLGKIVDDFDGFIELKEVEFYKTLVALEKSQNDYSKLEKVLIEFPYFLSKSTIFSFAPTSICRPKKH